MDRLSTIVDLHDQIGMDLAKHAGDRAAKAMLDAISLCDTPAQASMVAISVLGIIAAQVSGVVTKSLGIKINNLSTVEMLEILADLMREAQSSPEPGQEEAGR